MAGILFSIGCVVVGYLIEYLVAPIGPMIVEYLLGPIGKVIAYIYYYRVNVQGLRKEIEKLTLERERVQHMVDDARRNCEEIEADVRKWLETVQRIIQEAGRFFEAEAAAKKSFFCGLCPNFKSRYQLSRKAIKMLRVVDELQQEGRFDHVSYLVTPRWKAIAPVEGYKEFESRMPTAKNIMAAFRSESTSIIGVYGMGGVGKTTLLKQVGRQALEDKLFDDVVMATVTQNPDLKKIQGELADKLGLRFDEESVAGRAGHLRERLKKEEKILVILDDLWFKLDLDEIGIPHGDAHKGCKILLASRSLDVLSTEMDAENNFSLGVLLEKEAWELFRNMAGESVEDPELQSTAIEIAKECAGLPVAIVTVARALRNKNSYEWKNASRQLKRPNSRNIRGMQAVIYSSLELSYLQLESEELKSTFLLCGMMSYNGSLQDLLRYGIGLSLFRGVYTIEEVRDRVYTLVRNLKASCLLVDGNTNDSFKMHDVVRDVALSIADRDQHIFAARDDDGTVEWPDEDVLKKCTSISIHCDDIEDFPDWLHCTKLRFLYIGCKSPSFKIPDKFFKGVGALRVLHMVNLHFALLPSSISFLDNLRTLCLQQCTLEDLATISDLKKLVILSITGSDIEQLPMAVRQLSRLKVLDLSNCKKLKFIPASVISSLSQLEELYMANSFMDWEADTIDTKRGNASLAELKNLSQLMSLEIHIKDAKFMPKDISFEGLTRYRIFIGDIWDWSGEYETSRTLKLKLDSTIHEHDGLILLLKKTEDLYLDGLKGMKNVLGGLDCEELPQLKHLHVQNSSDLLYLIHSVEEDPCIAFPALESLYLYNLMNLEKICAGQLTTNYFNNLRTVKVENCHKLKNIFSFSMLTGLLELQEIKVTECKNIEEIVDEGEDDICENEPTDWIYFHHLHSLELEGLPNLMSFCSKVKNIPISGHKRKLPEDIRDSEDIILEKEHKIAAPLFNEQIAFPNLEILKLISIGTHGIWQDQPQANSSLSPRSISSFQNLTFLRIKSCDNLTHLLSASASASLVRLKRLEVHRCCAIEDIFSAISKQEKMETLLFPQLESLSLKNLPQLKRFCWGIFVSFPSLSKLCVKHCPNLEEFISCPERADISNNEEVKGTDTEENIWPDSQTLLSEKVALPCLKVMKLAHLDKIKKLWHNNINETSFSKLKAVKVKHFRRLQTIFPSNTLRRSKSLESLIAIDCDLLEEIFEVRPLECNPEETNAADATKLKRLYVSQLPKLKHVWTDDPVGILSFRNLQTVTASNCPSLKNLFPASVARGLLTLKQLEINSCGVKEIVSKDEGLEIAARFIFPDLTCMRLQDLPELRGFYPGMHSSQWPLMKNFDVIGCPKLEICTSYSHRSQETTRAGNADVPIQETLLVVGKDSFHNLENLRLEENEIMKEIWHDGFLAEFFNKTHSHLKSLKLSKLPHLRHLWPEDSRPGLVFSSLGSLEVSYCGCLKNLVPSSVAFDHLVTLEVSNCEALEKLVAPSTAKSMKQLSRISIDNCRMMVQIIEDMAGVVNEEIVFCQLKQMELHNLPSLASFCPGSQSLSFPSLEKVTIRQCPRFQTFCKGVLSVPLLDRVYTEEEEDEWFWEGDFAATIRKLTEDMVH